MVIIDGVVHEFLVRYPFVSAKVMSLHFDVSRLREKIFSAVNCDSGNTLGDGCPICSTTLRETMGADRQLSYFNCCGDGKLRILTGLEAVTSRDFNIIQNRAKCLQRSEKK
jgi:hypothetical protein